MRKKILLTMMLLTVCASGTNSIFATENVEKNEIEVYEISLKKFDYNKVCEWLLEKEPQECNIISQKNGSLIIESEESSVYVNEGTIEYKKDDMTSDIETLCFYYILPGLIDINEFVNADSGEMVDDSEDERIKNQIEHICEFKENETLQLIRSCKLSKETLVEVSEKLKQYGEENIDTSAWNAEEYTGLEYEILKDGIPVMGSEEPTQGYYLDIQQAIPAYVRVLMGDGKLIGVSIQEMFEEKSVYSTPILSSEEALGILQKEDEEIISDKTGEIEEIKLEYVMIPDWTTEISKPIELRPYWCIIKNVEEDGEQYTTADRINAITGGDLSYGE